MNVTVTPATNEIAPAAVAISMTFNSRVVR
jgi:hypothetical protein